MSSVYRYNYDIDINLSTESASHTEVVDSDNSTDDITVSDNSSDILSESVKGDVDGKDIGILDPDGLHPNPLTGSAYSDTYKELSAKWREFPAYANAREIITDIKDNQVILITSGTGSGKTVLIPKFCLHALNYTGKIAITLPKQMIAKSAAEFAALTLDVELGKFVGYQYRGSDKSDRSDENKLLYATDGTIVARLMNDPLLKEFDAVIIDEAHERKVQIDFLLYLLKGVVKARPEFKLIIMSATINVDIFEEYYKSFKFKSINIGGKTNYPIKSVFVNEKVSEKEYVEKGFEIIQKIIREDNTDDDGAHDILFFVTSVSETMDVCEKINDLNSDQNKESDIYCVEVYSGMDKQKQLMAQDKDLFKESTNKKRKIVIATNVAESSLTIDGIKFVIDSGLELFSYYDPKTRSNVLTKQLITLAQAKQRMGRSGRTEPGVCHHLYTKADFESNMKKFPEPTIRTSNLYDEFIKLLSLESIKDTNDLRKVLNDFIEPPDEKYVVSSLEQLSELSLIKNGKLTELGQTVSNMQFDPMEALSIYASIQFNCSKEVLAIISMINGCKGTMTELFNLPFDIVGDEDKERLKWLTKKFDKAKDVFNNRYGDHISLLKMFKTYDEKKGNDTKLKEWIYKYFLKRSTFEKSSDLYKKYRGRYHRISKDIEKIPIKDIMSYDISYRILASFLYGYRINLGIASKSGISTDRVKNADISRYSFLKYETKTKKIILYYELFTSSKVSMNIVSTVPKKSLELFEELMKSGKSKKT